MPAFGLPELLQRLNDRFALLTRRRGAVDRHRSLRTTVAWSYDLLSQDEQLVFDRLSVFAGDFDIAAADAVCRFEPLSGDVHLHVASLVERSMLNVARGPRDTRYLMLETVRQYGEEQLARRGETEAVIGQHLAHFVTRVETADAGIRGPDEALWHHRFEADWHNVRRAIGSAIERDDGDAACRLIWHIHWFASTRARLEVGAWADQISALDAARDHPLRPIVLACAGNFAYERGEWAGSIERVHEAVSEELRLGEAPEPWVAEVLCRSTTIFDDADGRLRRVEDLRRRVAGDPFFGAVVARHESILMWLRTSGEELSASEADEQLAIGRGAMQVVETFGNPGLIAHTVGNYGTSPLGALESLQRSSRWTCSTHRRRTPGDTEFTHIVSFTLSPKARHACSFMGPQDGHFCIWADPETLVSTLGPVFPIPPVRR